jgi:membrane associated rhomboid family serine protease
VPKNRAAFCWEMLKSFGVLTPWLSLEHQLKARVDAIFAGSQRLHYPQSNEGERVGLLKRLLGVIVSIMILAWFFGPVFGAPWRVGSYQFAGIVIIYASVSAWIIGLRMRRKIRKDLGRKATEADLTSIDTWMEVEQAEERNKENKPLG